MTDITPPPELAMHFRGVPLIPPLDCSDPQSWIAEQIYQIGADQELEACCEWVSKYLPYLGDFPMPEDKLRAARRPKPQTLNSIALQMLGTIERDAHYLPEITDIIRRALEALDD